MGSFSRGTGSLWVRLRARRCRSDRGPRGGSVLGSLLLLLLRPEHRVGERDRVDIARIGIGRNVRVDEEGDRQVLALAGLEMLARKAEALDLVEVQADLVRRHVVGR